MARDPAKGRRKDDAGAGGPGGHDPVAARAYGKWEAEGRPDGEHERHWHEAKSELEREKDPVKSAKSGAGKAGKGEPASSADAPAAAKKAARPRQPR